MDGKTHEIGKWDLLIAHPPCTYLTVAGNRWFDINKYGNKAVKRMKDRENAIEFFMKFINAKCEHIAVENPVGVISTKYRKPDQIIQPYYFGDHARKGTCLWLKGLPLLFPTSNLRREDCQTTRQATWFQRGGKERQKNRSKTFPGIAKAMADQWG